MKRFQLLGKSLQGRNGSNSDSWIAAADRRRKVLFSELGRSRNL